MSGIGKGIGKVVGSITGANQAADAQVKAAEQSNALQQQMYQESVQRYAPFLEAGKTGLQGLTGLVNNRQQALDNFFNSQEYAGLENQARYQQLSAAEATGGLGASPTANRLAGIAPQLGQNYMDSQYGRLMGLTGLGMNAAGMQTGAGMNYGASYGQNMNQIGAAKAGQATSGFGSLMSLAGLGLGAYGLLGGGTAAAASAAAPATAASTGLQGLGGMGMATGWKNYI